MRKILVGGTLAAAGQQVPNPTGAVSFVSVPIAVQGVEDLTNASFRAKGSA